MDTPGKIGMPPEPRRSSAAPAWESPPLPLNANPSGIACEQPGIELEPGRNSTSRAPPRLRPALAVQVASGYPASSMLVIPGHGSTEVSGL